MTSDNICSVHFSYTQGFLNANPETTRFQHIVLLLQWDRSDTTRPSSLMVPEFFSLASLSGWRARKATGWLLYRATDIYNRMDASTGRSDNHGIEVWNSIRKRRQRLSVCHIRQAVVWFRFPFWRASSALQWSRFLSVQGKGYKLWPKLCYSLTCMCKLLRLSQIQRPACDVL